MLRPMANRGEATGRRGHRQPVIHRQDQQRVLRCRAVSMAGQASILPPIARPHPFPAGTHIPAASGHWRGRRRRVAVRSRPVTTVRRFSPGRCRDDGASMQVAGG
jgi:hypothetical protein